MRQRFGSIRPFTSFDSETVTRPIMLPIHLSLSLKLFKSLPTATTQPSATPQTNPFAQLLSYCLEGIQTRDGAEPLHNFLDEVFRLAQSEPRTYLLPLNRFLAHVRDVFEKPDAAAPDVTNQLVNRSAAFLLPFGCRVVGPMIKSIVVVPDAVYLVAHFGKVLVTANDCGGVARSLIRNVLDVPGAIEVLLTDSTGYRTLHTLLVHFNLHADSALTLSMVDRLHAFVLDCSAITTIPPDVEAYVELHDACNALIEILKLQSARIQASGAGILGATAVAERLHGAKIIVPKKERGDEDYFKAKRESKDAERKQQIQVQKAWVEEISFSEKYLHYFDVVGVKPPAAFEKFEETLSRLEIVKHKILQLYLDSTILPNRTFHKIALKLHQPATSLPTAPAQGPTDRATTPPPIVQPLSPPSSPSKSSNISSGPSDFSAQYEDDLGPWTILLSDKAVTDLHNLRSEESFKAVKMKLQELASGIWTSDNAKSLARGPMSLGVGLFEAKTLHNQRIIWQVDVSYLQRLNAIAQVIKVWAIGSHKHVDTMTDRYLWMVHLGYSDEQRRRCHMRSSLKRGPHGVPHQFLPLVFDEGAEPVVLDRAAVEEALCEQRNMTEEDLLELHNLRVTTKFIPLSKTVLRSILAGSTDFAFSVSRQEHEIIQYSSSAIVIGRSGTGKTTTIVFRMLALYQANHSRASECLYKTASSPEPELTHLHQIFLTQSAVLCTRVRTYFHRLLQSTERATLSRAQIISAARYRLAMDRDAEGAMIEDDEEEELLADVPNNMDELREDHFPLFLTVSKFLEMLEGTYEIRHFAEPQSRVSAARRFSMRGGAEFKRLPQDEEEEEAEEEYDEDGDESGSDDEGVEGEYSAKVAAKDVEEVLDIQQSWAHYVTYEVFETKYWPRINTNLTRNLDCALVFSEIMSVIKGSEAVLSTEKGYLSRDMYVKLSRKMYPGLSYAREAVYDIFQQYQKLKARFNDYDPPDRSFAVLRSINKEGYNSTVLHEIYVDECQDNNICDYAVLMKLVTNPNGLFFAGDTAQAVARGSLFRFADLRSMIYRKEQQHPHVVAGVRKPVQPKLFQLATNYRSHNGILQLGANVIEMLHRFFPSTVDNLDKERGIVDGPKPIFFDGFTARDFHFEFFCFGERSNEFIEFGAEQCIIVRNEAAKEKLRQRIGKVGLVMTIYEAKGLEFTDILLYNFWQDSPAQSKWRVVLSSLGHGPVFDYEKHAIMSDELKQLYVAITRARSHLWIFDENMEFSEPMKRVWTSANLVQVVTTTDKKLPSLGTKSSNSEWDKQGRNLFERRQYEHAVFCFTKSGNFEAKELSQAYAFRDQARRLASNSTDRDMVKSAFVTAASAFEECQRPRRAAVCYQTVGMHRAAGECLKRAMMFEQAVLAFMTGGHYDEAVDIVESKKSSEIPTAVANKVRRIARLYFSKTKQHEKAIKLSTSLDEMVEFYLEHNMLQELADLYEKKSMFIKAGDLLKSLDRLEDAADLYAQDVSQQGTIAALECYSTLAGRNSPRMFELRNTSDKRCMAEATSLENKQRAILTKAESIVNSCSTESSLMNPALDFVVHKIKLFRSQIDRSVYFLRACANFFRGKSTVNEYRALEMYFGLALRTYNVDISMENWKAELQLAMRLCDCVFALLKTTPQSAKDDNWEELFCVDTHNVADTIIDRRVYVFSPLIPHILQTMSTASEDPNSFEQVGKAQTNFDHKQVFRALENDEFFRLCAYEYLQLAAHQIICTRLWKLITDIGGFARHSVIFTFSSDPCVAHLVFNNCRYQGCKCEHIDRLESKSFYERKSLLLLQLKLIHNLTKLHRHPNLVLESQLAVYRPILRAWEETWVRNIQVHSMEMESADLLRKVTVDLPPFMQDEFFNLISNVWLKPVSSKDFSIVTRAVLLIQSGMDRRLRSWIMTKISEFEAEASWAVRDAPPPGMVKNLRGHGWYWMVTPFVRFFEHMDSGDVKTALLNGDRFLRFCLSMPNELILDPWHLIYLLEYTTTLLIFIKSRGHNILLPRSFLHCFVRDNVDRLLQCSESNEWRDDFLNRLCFNTRKSVMRFVYVLGNLCMFELRHNMLQVLLARVMRLGVILGCNDQNLSGSDIMRFYRGVNIVTINTRLLFYKYTEAKSWKDMVGALQSQYSKTNGMDELLMVKREDREMAQHVADSISSISVMHYRNSNSFGTALDEFYNEAVAAVTTSSPSSFETILARLNMLKTTSFDHFKPGQPQSIGMEPEPVPEPSYMEEIVHDANDRNEEPMREGESFNPFTFRDDPVPVNPYSIKDAVRAAEIIKRWFKKHMERRAKASGHADAGHQEVFAQMAELAHQLPESSERKVYAMMLRGPVADLYYEMRKYNAKMEWVHSGMQERSGLSPEELERLLDETDVYKWVSARRNAAISKPLSLNSRPTTKII
ncbi:hypothetical protein BC936DRAFT_145324 [Jimgerdemannia flammicorona]|uniref:UvrD-like helicase ATP-binding domain-containing protein n=1 Tax=Jimgerdemannia flammicorona TaxID=994334 RepID=A0A433DAA8_9FUNG|nr:hypothetical protein BC936DRAFT_145324 [Jimgerdemannia flammicorona]